MGLFSRIETPLPKFGFPARGVYPFHSFVSKSLRFCGTFRLLLPNLKDLSNLAAVIRLTNSPAYWAEREHYKHCSLCRRGLSSACINKPRLLKTCRILFYSFSIENTRVSLLIITQLFPRINNWLTMSITVIAFTTS